MKKILMLLLIPGFGFAQEPSTVNSSDCPKAYIGVRFMPTLTSVNIHQQDNDNVKGTMVLGYGFGAVVGYNFTKHVGVQGEVIYSALSQRFVSGERKQRLDLAYINIPVLLSLNTNSCGKVNFNFVAGPQVGINTGSRLKTEDGNGADSVQAVVAVKPADLGLAYGAGIDLALTSSIHLGIGFRGVYGLIDISDNSNTTTTNQYYILDRSKVKTYSAYVGLSLAF